MPGVDFAQCSATQEYRGWVRGTEWGHICCGQGQAGYRSEGANVLGGFRDEPEPLLAQLMLFLNFQDLFLIGQFPLL